MAATKLAARLGLSLLGLLAFAFVAWSYLQPIRQSSSLSSVPALVTEPTLQAAQHRETPKATPTPKPKPARLLPVQSEQLAALPSEATETLPRVKESRESDDGASHPQDGVKAGWRQFAVASTADPMRPWIAIVLDDVGVNRAGTARAIRMPAPMTLAFMTYARDLDAMTAAARSEGHELMVHFPMEPEDLANNDPGENALLLGLSDAELERRLQWGLSRFQGFVGLNNHMGSRFTKDRRAMRKVSEALKRRGLLFLDSRTTAESVAASEARRAGLTVLERDIFLDHEPTPEGVLRQLQALEAKARQQGYAIGIGHPQDYTLDVLEAWLPQAKARGFSIVPLSAIALRLEETG